ncbi:unnamed protein product [Caenorhabditis sp. 36 PRJEB53466]|nr:unnamed protein product [Caenorhabditis sp. 36 PRJEB53466]
MLYEPSTSTADVVPNHLPNDYSMPSKVDYSKVGSLSVSMNIVGQKDRVKSIVFSIHYFEEGVKDRKSKVFLQRTRCTEINADMLTKYLREALGNDRIVIENFLSPHRELGEELREKGVVRRNFVCFSRYVKTFVKRILKIKVFERGLNQLRTFVQEVERTDEFKAYLSNLLPANNAKGRLPALDDSSWQSTGDFLRKSLLLHEAFKSLAGEFMLDYYLTEEMYQHLLRLSCLLQQCRQQMDKLSVAHNSISQMVPASEALKSYISTSLSGYKFGTDIQEAHAEIFCELRNGRITTRHDLATFLDPRFGHRPTINVYKMVVRFTDKILSNNKNNERKLRSDFQLFRGYCQRARPADDKNPFVWWEQRREEMAILAPIALDNLACPAVAIDGAYYFGENGLLGPPSIPEKGKSVFEHDPVNLGENLNQQEDAGLLIGKNTSDECNKRARSMQVFGESRIVGNRVVYGNYEPVEEVYTVQEVQRAEDGAIYAICQPDLAVIDERELAVVDPLEEVLSTSCVFCGCIENQVAVSVEIEKLLLCLRAMYRQEMTKEDVKLLVARPEMFACFKHFPETRDFIFSAIGVQNTRAILTATAHSFKSMDGDIADIWGLPFGTENLRKALMSFTDEYRERTVEQPFQTCSFCAAVAETSQMRRIPPNASLIKEWCNLLDPILLNDLPVGMEHYLCLLHLDEPSNPVKTKKRRERVKSPMDVLKKVKPNLAEEEKKKKEDENERAQKLLEDDKEW